MNESMAPKSIRVWPGIVAVSVIYIGLFVVPVIAPDVPSARAYGAIAGMLGGMLGLIVWWSFFSRAPRAERFGAMALVAVAMFATSRILHESVAAGNMGAQYVINAIPVVSLAFVLWAVTTRHLANGIRRATMVATILLTCGGWALLRSDGITGNGSAEFTWRWSETAEERLLAETSADLTAPIARESAHLEASWPGLRGSDRDGVISGLWIETDWSMSPPVEMWRRPIGPSVSSFAVLGELVYTHEQRGEEEVVSAHNLSDGKPVWRHSDKARFWDSHVGAGPRANPAVSSGRVFTFGATGILNALDADDGSVLWRRDAASDTDAKLPMWGFVSSPLIFDDIVIVHTNALAAYDVATGKPRWFGPDSGSLSSPHRMTVDGVEQIFLQSHDGAIGVAPTDGALLWEHSWPGIGIVQPALTADGDILISIIDDMAAGVGTRRISVRRKSEGWTTEKRWTSHRLKPSFSSFVVHEGHAFGFDGRILSCIDVEDGSRKWKGGRYGHGQLILLFDQDVLLVLTEQGELALVSATPDEFTELARIPAIEGKTWNHPVLVGDVLLVRNREEMAAFRLSLARP